MIIDSYAHVSLRNYQPVERLMEQMELAGVDRAVLVQPLGDFDNAYMQATLHRYARRFTAVGLIDTNSCDFVSRLKVLIQTHGFAGLRATAEALSNREAVATLAALGGVLVAHLPDGIGQHLGLLTAISQHFAHLRVFVPHLGWPRVGKETTPNWEEAIAALSANSNVAIGISAMYHFSARPFPHEDTWPWIETLVEKFGPERCLVGSDFPRLLEAESYAEFFGFFSQGGPQFSRERRAWLLGEAALRFWRIEP